MDRQPAADGRRTREDFSTGETDCPSVFELLVEGLGYCRRHGAKVECSLDRSHRMVFLGDGCAEHADRRSALVNRDTAVTPDDVAHRAGDCVGRSLPLLGTH